MVRGILVALEGVDGSGKSTQIPLLARHLKAAGIESSIYSYPTHDKFYGRIIRKQFLAGKLELSPVEQVCLYLLDMVRDKGLIEKDLDAGKVVFLDRYFFSTIAYQSSNGFDYEEIKMIASRIMKLPSPTLVLYFDIPAKDAFKRKAKQKKLTADRMEKDLLFQEKVRSFYLKLWADGYGAKRWAKIDAKKDISAITKAAFIEIKTTYTGELNDSIRL